jgi:tRNA(Ile)-lysidine synthase
MRPKGLTGTKKLQDLYTDCKVPRSERNTVPVVQSNGGRILSVLGVRNGDLALSDAELCDIAAHNPDELILIVRMV